MRFVNLLKEIIKSKNNKDNDWVFMRLSDGRVFDGQGREVEWCPIEDYDGNGFVWWPIFEEPIYENEDGRRRSIRPRQGNYRTSMMKKRKML